jgi:arginine/ornithine N-succinyltransferase beta subunit
VIRALRLTGEGAFTAPSLPPNETVPLQRLQSATHGHMTGVVDCTEVRQDRYLFLVRDLAARDLPGEIVVDSLVDERSRIFSVGVRSIISASRMKQQAQSLKVIAFLHSGRNYAKEAGVFPSRGQ